MATPTNLPAAFSSGAVLTAAQQNALRGAFRVLQVVYGSTTTEVNNATSTFADTTLTASITPQSSSSKVLVMVSQNGCFKNNANSQNRMVIRILRDATNIGQNGSLFLYTDTATGNGGSFSMSVLDTPATISATTYKTQFQNPANTSGISVQENSARSTMILMEISA
jgi:hypothetical protein